MVRYRSAVVTRANNVLHTVVLNALGNTSVAAELRVRHMQTTRWRAPFFLAAVRGRGYLFKSSRLHGWRHHFCLEQLERVRERGVLFDQALDLSVQCLPLCVQILHCSIHC